MNLMEVEAGRGNCDYDAVGELRELRAHFEVRYHQCFLFRITEPNVFFLDPGSQICIKEFRYLNSEKIVSKLSRKYDPGCSSRIRFFLPILDPGSA